MSDLGLSRQRIDRVRGRTRDSLVGPTAGAEPMPMPGYQSGLNVTFDARNEQVIVGPGVAVVKGQLVTRQSATNLADDADTWIAAKSAEKHYYVYLRDDGDLKVDIDVPVIDTEQLAYYHPEHNNLRAIGKLWLDTSQKTIFATPRFLRELNVVLVGASDYTDLSDYQARATGAHLEINYAIQYVNEAFGGGTVLLSPGTFNTSAQIFLASGVTLEGTGAGSTTISHSSTVGISSTSITTVTIRRLRIEASTTITSNSPSILIASGAEASTIEDVTIDATNYRHTSAGGAVIVVDASGLVIARRVTILNAGGAGHALSASNSALGTMTGRAVVADCIVEFTAADSTASDRVGINLVANDSIVRNCRVSDNATSGFGDAVGILVDGDDNHVYGNYVEGTTSSGAGTAVGIRVGSGELRNRITDNFFAGNDSDIDDQGTDTVVNLDFLSAETANWTIGPSGSRSYFVTTGSTDRTGTLPAASKSFGQRFFVMKADTGTGKVIISRAGSDTLGVNDVTSMELWFQGNWVELMSDGSSKWWVVGTEMFPIPFASRPTTWNPSADTTQGSWTAADWSSRVPAGTAWALVHTLMELQADGTTDAVVLYLRPTGSGLAINASTRVMSVEITNTPHTMRNTVECVAEMDSSRSFDWHADIAGAGASITKTWMKEHGYKLG